MQTATTRYTVYIMIRMQPTLSSQTASSWNITSQKAIIWILRTMIWAIMAYFTSIHPKTTMAACKIWVSCLFLQTKQWMNISRAERDNIFMTHTAHGRMSLPTFWLSSSKTTRRNHSWQVFLPCGKVWMTNQVSRWKLALTISLAHI